jgi:hypothetical protein
VVLDGDSVEFVLDRLVFSTKFFEFVVLIVITFAVLLDVLFVLVNVDLELVDFLFISLFHSVMTVLEIFVLMNFGLQLYVKMLVLIIPLAVLVLKVLELHSDFVEIVLILLGFFLFVTLVFFEFVADLIVVVVEVFVFFFPVTTFGFAIVTEFDTNFSLFSVMRHGNLHLVDVHSHFVFFFNSVLPFFDHAVFTLEIDVSLVLKKSDSFFKLVNSVLIETVHALHVLNSLVHNSGVRALIREVKADRFGSVVSLAFDKNGLLDLLHLSVSFSIGLLGGPHESVHVLINSFLGVTKLFLKLEVELIFVVGLLFKLFDSSNQNKVSLFLSIEQVHKVGNLDGNLVGADHDLSFLGLCLFLLQFGFEGVDSLLHHFDFSFVDVRVLILFLVFVFVSIAVVGDFDVGGLLVLDNTAVITVHTVLDVILINMEVSDVGCFDNRDLSVNGKEAISDRQFD